MTSVTFDEISLTGVKNVKCSGCGKKLKRQQRFFQTLNPFNKDKNGMVKSKHQIYTELEEDIKKWEVEPEKCRNCN